MPLEILKYAGGICAMADTLKKILCARNFLYLISTTTLGDMGFLLMLLFYREKKQVKLFILGHPTRKCGIVKLGSPTPEPLLLTITPYLGEIEKKDHCK
jgi:hypothetical protein